MYSVIVYDDVLVFCGHDVDVYVRDDERDVCVHDEFQVCDVYDHGDHVCVHVHDVYVHVHDAYVHVHDVYDLHRDGCGYDAHDRDDYGDRGDDVHDHDDYGDDVHDHYVYGLHHDGLRHVNVYDHGENDDEIHYNNVLVPFLAFREYRQFQYVYVGGNVSGREFLHISYKNKKSDIL